MTARQANLRSFSACWAGGSGGVRAWLLRLVGAGFHGSGGLVRVRRDGGHGARQPGFGRAVSLGQGVGDHVGHSPAAPGSSAAAPGPASRRRCGRSRCRRWRCQAAAGPRPVHRTRRGRGRRSPAAGGVRRSSSSRGRVLLLGVCDDHSAEVHHQLPVRIRSRRVGQLPYALADFGACRSGGHRPEHTRPGPQHARTTDGSTRSFRNSTRSRLSWTMRSRPRWTRRTGALRHARRRRHVRWPSVCGRSMRSRQAHGKEPGATCSAPGGVARAVPRWLVLPGQPSRRCRRPGRGGRRRARGVPVVQPGRRQCERCHRGRLFVEPFPRSPWPPVWP